MNFIRRACKPISEIPALFYTGSFAESRFRRISIAYCVYSLIYDSFEVYDILNIMCIFAGKDAVYAANLLGHSLRGNHFNMACNYGNADFVSGMLESGFVPEKSHHMNAMEYALRKRNYRMVRVLFLWNPGRSEFTVILEYVFLILCMTLAVYTIINIIYNLIFYYIT